MIYERTSSDVEELIHYAKLRECDLTATTQVLKLSSANNENLKLLQLDRHLEDELLSGKVLKFKGGRNENAVLCTSTKTYDVKEAETSNSLLLIPGLLWAKDTENEEDKRETVLQSPRKLVDMNILNIFYNYFEVRLCEPKLRKLNEILQFTIYTGPEREYAIDRELLYTFEKLATIIQCSDEELRAGLSSIKALDLDGFYRILSFDYEFRVLSQMLDLIEENSWPLDEIDKNETLETLSNLIPVGILEHVFNHYATENDKQLFTYDENKICKIFARYILKDSEKFNLNDFLAVWKNSVPEGMNVELETLRGIALYDANASVPVIWSFYESKLPENITERFKVLFQTKDKWTVEEIAPYIERFQTDKINVKTLLTKYARGFTQNNVRYYCGKHSK